MNPIDLANLKHELAKQRYTIRQQRFAEQQARKKAATKPADYWEYNADNGKHYVKTPDGIEAVDHVLVNAGLDQDTRLEYQFGAIDSTSRFHAARTVEPVFGEREVHWARAGFRVAGVNTADLLLYTDVAGIDPIVIQEDLEFTSSASPHGIGLYYETAGTIIIEYPIQNTTAIPWGPYLTTFRRNNVGFKVWRVSGTTITELTESPTWRKPFVEAPYHVYYADRTNYYYPYPNQAWEPEQWPADVKKEWGYLASGFSLNIQKDTVYLQFRSATEMYVTENQYELIPNAEPDPVFQSLQLPDLEYTEIDKFKFTYDPDLADIFIGGPFFSSSFGFVVIE